MMALGHEVKLIHAKFVRPFVQTNKTDAADAKAIWTAIRQPGMRTIAGKTEEQQAMLALHQMRISLIKFRMVQVNQLRGLLYEFGVTLKGDRLAGLSEIPGVGMLTATALVATMGEANGFKSGREFAAFVGLVPRQSGTGGKVKLLGISKNGDTY